MARSPGSNCSVAWRRTETPSISSNMPLSDMMPSSRRASRLCGRRPATARSSVAIKRLLERLLAEAAEGIDEGLGRAFTAGGIGIDQPLDGVGHVVGNETVAENVADGGLLGGVAADGDLVELGALLLDAQNADMGHVVVAAGIDAARNLDLEIAVSPLPLGRAELARNFLGDRDRTGIGQRAEI